MALFKKGKKGGKTMAKKGKKMQYEQDMGDPRQEYVEMMQPRENMERVEEDQEEDVAGHDESQQIMAGSEMQHQQM